MKKITNRTKVGSYAFAAVLIVLAILIAINFIAMKLPTRYTKFDVTAKKLYTLSDVTKKAIPNITEEVNIYLLCSGGTDSSGSSPNNLPTLSTYLSKYAELSENVKFKIIDPVENPNFTSKYTTDSLENYSIIVESAKRFKIINFSELYYYYNEQYGEISSDQYSNVMAYLSYYGQNVSFDLCFDGESVITSALDFVTTDNIPTVYTVNDHGETALSETLLADIGKDNINVLSLPLMTTEIPSDAECLIMNIPTTDINGDEAAKLSAYLAGGGHLILTTSPAYTNLPNLMSVLEGYGLSAEEGIIIEEETGSYYTYPYCLLPTASTDCDVTSSLAGSAYFMALGAHAINIADGKNCTPLFTTSSSAYITPADAESAEKTENSVVGTRNVSVLCEDESGAKIIWTASDVFNDNVNQYTSGGNYKYFMSMLGSLVERTRITYEIPAHTVGANYLVVSEAQATMWSAILIILIPLAFAASGIVYWYQRRRR